METKTAQELADMLNLSRVTVWKVLHNKPGVAPQTVRRVLDALSESDAEKDASLRKNVTLVASRTDNSIFWGQIVDQVAYQLNQSQISMSYYPLEAMGLSPEMLDSALHSSRTDGCLILNVYDPSTLRQLSLSGLPSVYLDAAPGFDVSTLHGDLFLLEGRRTVEAITESLLRAGHKRIGFIGDIHYAITNLHRYQGFAEAMKRHGLAIDPDCCLTVFPAKQEYKPIIQRFFDSLTVLPDAFVCANDYIVFLVHSLLSQGSEPIPALTGYDNALEFNLNQSNITTAAVQNDMIGRRMVRQLLFRMDNPNADPEEIQIVPQIIYR